jgi:hypothetical protein
MEKQLKRRAKAIGFEGEKEEAIADRGKAPTK